MRKSKKRRASNASIVANSKTAIRRFNLLLAEKKFDEAKKCLGDVSSGIMKAAKKGILHKNTASRKISRLSKRLDRTKSSKE